MKAISLILTASFCVVIGVTDLLAQAPPPSSNPPGAPLDAMVSILLLGGGAYALREFRKEK